MVKSTSIELTAFGPKALLMAINAKAASMDGNAGSGVGNAGSAASAAQDLSDALADKLTTAATTYMDSSPTFRLKTQPE
jgi:hypothetical protein